MRASILQKLVAAVGILLLGACASDQADDADMAAGQDQTAQQQQQQARAGDGVESEPLTEGPEPGTQEDLEAVVGTDRVFFATDRSDLSEEARETLRQQAEWLMEFPSVTVTVEGHCDERGTREYNLALGERRANAVKDYLVALGIAPSRVTTISYGKERPAVLGSDPDAWAQNRRAVMVVN